MKKFLVIIIHSLLWIVLVSIFGLINILENPNTPLSGRISDFLVLTFYCVASVYFHYSYLFPVYFAKRKYIKFALFSIAGGIIISGITKTFTVFHGGFTTKSEDILTIFAGAAGVLIIGQMGTLLRALVEWFNSSKKNEVLEKQRLMAELSFLKSQINPHFMFNTLSNIDTLIFEDPKKASDSLMKLSALFRYMVYETSKNSVKLENEILYLRDLIELQRMRIKSDKSIIFEVTGSAKEKYIAPMLFVPLIENAFKHCSDKEVSDAINIRIDIYEKKIRFFSENIYEVQKISSETSGVGLELVKKRLNIIYPEQHKLEITKTSNTFMINLEIENFAN